MGIKFIPFFMHMPFSSESDRVLWSPFCRVIFFLFAIPLFTQVGDSPISRGGGIRVTSSHD